MEKVAWAFFHGHVSTSLVGNSETAGSKTSSSPGTDQWVAGGEGIEGPTSRWL